MKNFFSLLLLVASVMAPFNTAFALTGFKRAGIGDPIVVTGNGPGHVKKGSAINYQIVVSDMDLEDELDPNSKIPDDTVRYGGEITSCSARGYVTSSTAKGSRTYTASGKAKSYTGTLFDRGAGWDEQIGGSHHNDPKVNHTVVIEIEE